MGLIPQVSQEEEKRLLLSSITTPTKFIKPLKQPHMDTGQLFRYPIQTKIQQTALANGGGSIQSLIWRTKTNTSSGERRYKIKSYKEKGSVCSLRCCPLVV